MNVERFTATYVQLQNLLFDTLHIVYYGNVKIVPHDIVYGTKSTRVGRGRLNLG